MWGKWKREGGKWGKMCKTIKEGRKMRYVRGKGLTKAEDLFIFLFTYLFIYLFIFLLFTLGNHWNFFGDYQNGNFYQKKDKITPGKNRKSDFARSENFSCYAPVREKGHKFVQKVYGECNSGLYPWSSKLWCLACRSLPCFLQKKMNARKG